VTADRFGLGFRPELAAALLANLDRVGVVEVIAEPLFDASHKRRSALRTLARQCPVLLHGVSLGLASASDVDDGRLSSLARTVDWLQPERVSEHLAFVRAGGVELGHLAAPPRTDATVEGTARNVARARAALGMPIDLENVATLIEPPASRYDEAAWVTRALDAAGASLLLDLQNLYVNAHNFGAPSRGGPTGRAEQAGRVALAALRRLPLERVRVVHLAGGRPVRGEHGVTRLLDDHLHPVAEPVFALLEALGALVPQALDVVIERDGRYPEFSALLAELDAARSALARGRARRSAVVLSAPQGIGRVA